MNIVIVGGGAAGLFGAIAVARQQPRAQVTVLEAGPTFLAKVLISGGGRCNVTHACFDPAELVGRYPRGDRALRGPFAQFQPRDTIAWFAAEGVRLKTEEDGRMFPTTDDARTIATALLRAAERSGVQLRSRAPVVAINAPPAGQRGPFQVRLPAGETLLADRLLLATGSSPQGHRLAVGLGHTLVPPVPSLFTFRLSDDRLAELAGLAVPTAHLRLWPDLPAPGKKPPRPFEQTGPLLITHWGLSGPAVLKLSAWAARSLHTARYRAKLHINWVAPHTLESLRPLLQTTKQECGRKTVSSSPPLALPRRLWQRLVAAAGVGPDDRWATVSKGVLGAIAQELCQGEFAVLGKGPFKEEFVTCGGVSLAEVNFKTMESRRCGGLFFAGEVLDLDGITGGFNFQSAWTTAWLAGRAMGQPEHEGGG